MDLTTMPLTILAEMANGAAEACEQSARRTVEQAATCGRALLAAKEQCGHGHWLHWLGQNFDYDKATAQRYMQVAKAASVRNLADHDSVASVLRVLADERAAERETAQPVREPKPEPEPAAEHWTPPADMPPEEPPAVPQTVVDHAVRDYFRQRHAEEAKHVAERMRKEGIYPYSQFPKTPVEKAERQVFDICAATVHEYLPQFDTADRNARQFTYRLLREALESSPSNLSHIFKEVLKLSEDQQENLVHLLGKTSLGAIIHSAKTVADRLTFINGLEQILHEKTIRKHLKERTQLHRILVEELWLFGDEYTLGGDDVSLKTVLSDHRDILDLPALDQNAVVVADLDDVPDLLLWKQYLRGSGDRFEHLVIELKRPTVNISQTEIGQVKRYATKVLANKYFDKEKTHWTFIALSDGIAADAQEDVTQRDREPGHVINGTHHDVWVLTWSQVIQAAKIRLNWIQSRLEFEVEDNSEGMRYLRGGCGAVFKSAAAVAG